jgi:integrase/recombinase XerC
MNMLEPCSLPPPLYITSELWDSLHNWLNGLAETQGYSHHTVRAYQHDITAFCAFLAEYMGGQITIATIADLNKWQIRAWLAHRLRSGFHPHSTRRSLSSLKHMAYARAKRRSTLS